MLHSYFPIAGKKVRLCARRACLSQMCPDRLQITLADEPVCHRCVQTCSRLHWPTSLSVTDVSRHAPDYTGRRACLSQMCPDRLQITLADEPVCHRCNSSTSFCLRSSSCRTDLSIDFQPNRLTTI